MAMEPHEIQRVENDLGAEADADRERRYHESVAGWPVAIATSIWAAFLLWEDFREHLMQEGMWWVPLAATLGIVVAAMMVSKKGVPPSSR